MDTIEHVHDFIIAARLQFSQGKISSVELNALMDECVARLCQIGGSQGNLEPSKDIIGKALCSVGGTSMG